MERGEVRAHRTLARIQRRPVRQGHVRPGLPQRAEHANRGRVRHLPGRHALASRFDVSDQRRPGSQSAHVQRVVALVGVTGAGGDDNLEISAARRRGGNVALVRLERGLGQRLAIAFPQ